MFDFILYLFAFTGIMAIGFVAALVWLFIGITRDPYNVQDDLEEIDFE